jgi:hypothetical protein
MKVNFVCLLLLCVLTILGCRRSLHILNSGKTVTISGSIVDCKNQPANSGFLRVLLDGMKDSTAIINGNFAITMKRNSDMPTIAKLILVDMSGNPQDSARTLQVTEGSFTAPLLQVCPEFVNFVLNGVTCPLARPKDSIFANRLSQEFQITAYSYDGGYRAISFGLPLNPTAGTRPLTYVQVNSGVMSITTNDKPVTTIAEYGPVNGFIIGSFSGTINDPNKAIFNIPVSCEYRVRRKS